MKSKLALALLAVLFSVSQAYNPGITGSISADFAVRYKQQITQFILKMIQTVKIPDIPFDQGHVNNNVWSLAKITADQVNITISEEDNAVGLIINDVMG